MDRVLALFAVVIVVWTYFDVTESGVIIPVVRRKVSRRPHQTPERGGTRGSYGTLGRRRSWNPSLDMDEWLTSRFSGEQAETETPDTPADNSNIDDDYNIPQTWSHDSYDSVIDVGSLFSISNTGEGRNDVFNLEQERQSSSDEDDTPTEPPRTFSRNEDAGRPDDWYEWHRQTCLLTSTSNCLWVCFDKENNPWGFGCCQCRTVTNDIDVAHNER